MTFHSEPKISMVFLVVNRLFTIPSRSGWQREMGGGLCGVHSKKMLVLFAGIDSTPCQSGQMNIRSRSMSKRGFSALRSPLFLAMSVLLQRSPLMSRYISSWPENIPKESPTESTWRILPTSSSVSTTLPWKLFWLLPNSCFFYTFLYWLAAFPTFGPLSSSAFLRIFSFESN